MDSNTHSTSRPAAGWRRWRPSSTELAAQRPGPAGRRRPGRTGAAAAAAGGPGGRPLAGRAGRGGCPRGRRRRTGRPGRLHRRLAARPAAHECRHRRQPGPDRPGPVPRSPDRHRPGPGRGGHLASPRPGAGPRHPGPARPPRRRGRTGAAGGGPAAGPAPAATGRCPSAAGGRPRRRRPHQRTPPSAAGVVAVADLGGHGRHPGLLDPEAGQTLLAALEPLARPSQRRTTPAPVASAAPMPLRAGPPHPGSRPAPPERWGATPAAGDRRPGQPPRPRWAGRGGRRALAAGPRDLPAAGLRRRRHPGAGHPPPRPQPRPRQR